MKNYHYYFYILTIIIFIFIGYTVFTKNIKKNRKEYIYRLIDFIFKLSFSIFIIIYFSKTNIVGLNNDDRVLIIICGFVLILLIDYKKIIDIVIHKKYINYDCVYDEINN